MSFFYPDQLYPGSDPFEVARQMGLNPLQAMQMLQGGSGQMGGPQGALAGGMGAPDYDPNLLAEMVGQQYNPYQGYPTKQVSDQVWDVYGPTPEYMLPQLYNIQNPDAGRFDLDAFFQANPTIQGPLAEAHQQAKGDPIDMFALLQNNQPVESVNAKGESVMQPGIQDRLRQEVGRTEWADLAEQGYKPIIRAFNQGASPEELDKIAMDYYMSELEGVLAGGAPTSQRAEAQLDYTRQREGFRPAPGTGSPYPQYEGPGFGGGSPGADDPLADLAQSPQYATIGGRNFTPVRETAEGVWVRPGGGGGDFSAPGRRAAQRIRRGDYGARSSGPRRRGGRRSGGRGGGGIADQVYGIRHGTTPVNRVMSWLNPFM